MQIAPQDVDHATERRVVEAEIADRLAQHVTDELDDGFSTPTHIAAIHGGFHETTAPLRRQAPRPRSMVFLKPQVRPGWQKTLGKGDVARR